MHAHAQARHMSTKERNRQQLDKHWTQDFWLGEPELTVYLPNGQLMHVEAVVAPR